MKTLLIVDDSRIFQKIVEKILSPYYLVAGRGNCGIEGFEQYKKLKPDLVVMDITMPNCNGKDCLQKIMEFDPQAKVIMVSSIGDEATVKQCLALGAKAFVNKDEVSHSDSDQSKLVQSAIQVLPVDVKSEAA